MNIVVISGAISEPPRLDETEGVYHFSLQASLPQIAEEEILECICRKGQVPLITLAANRHDRIAVHGILRHRRRKDGTGKDDWVIVVQHVASW